MQNIYAAGQKWECHTFDKALKNVCQLLKERISDKVVFTRYIAADVPKGVWKDYNRENADVNADEWANELVPELKPYIMEYPYFDKSYLMRTGW